MSMTHAAWEEYGARKVQPMSQVLQRQWHRLIGCVQGIKKRDSPLNSTALISSADGDGSATLKRHPWTPKGIHILIPRTCEYMIPLARGIRVINRIKFANQLTLR